MGNRIITDQYDRIILELTKQNAQFRAKIGELESEISRAEQKLSKIGIPSGFEDGNSWDDYSFGERLNILIAEYEELKEKSND